MAAGEFLPWQASRFVTVGKLKKVISDGCWGANLGALAVARNWRLQTCGFCGPKVPPSVRRSYNLIELKKMDPLESRHTHTGAIAFHLETPNALFLRRTIENMKMANGWIFINFHNLRSTFQLIGYCFHRELIEIETIYRDRPFFYWPDHNIFVVNKLDENTAINLRNWIIMKGLESVCIIGDIPKPPVNTYPFFQKAFVIHPDELG